MTTQKTHPVSDTIDQGAKNDKGFHTKDTKNLSKRQQKVYDLLRTGKHSVTDITIKLGYGDPRSYIRDLRDKGINIQDEWVDNGDVRYKRFWAVQKPSNGAQGSFLNLFDVNQYERD